MKDYDLGETRVGTNCTFTGGGSSEKEARVPPRLVGSVLAALFLIAVGAGYFLSQPPPQSALPPLPAPMLPAFPLPGPDTAPSLVSQPTLPPPIPFDRPGSGAPAQAPRSAPRVQASAARATAKSQPVSAKSPQPTASANHAAGAAAAPAAGRFHVQTGAFASRDGALSLLARLRDHGYAVTLKEGQVFRVWVGGYLDRSTARRLAENLQADGFQATLTAR